MAVVLERIGNGSVSLTAVRLLSDVLTQDNHLELLDAATHKSKREIECLIATRRPAPPVPSSVRKLASPPVGTASSHRDDDAAPASGPAMTPMSEMPRAKRFAVSTVPPRRDAVAPLSAEHYSVRFTISNETHDKLRRVQDLMRHTNRTGDLACLFAAAIDVLLERLEKHRIATTDRPRTPTARSGVRSRRIPAAVRRAVWARDAGRCAFIGADGRCRETSLLQFHHMTPHAVGGLATAANIQLRCVAHNQYQARIDFPADLATTGSLYDQ